MKQRPFTYIKSFGLKLWLTQILILILNKFNIFITLKEKLTISKNKQIIIYLSKKYKYIIEKYNDYENKENKYSNKIWVFWYQGIDNAPILIKKCIESIKKQCKDKEIIVITKENIEDYYKIPEYIKSKINNKQITLTHLSDILRMNLLKKYGGHWIDATIFLTDNPFKNDSFNTIKFHTNELTSISNGKWCGFFIGGKNQIFYNFMVDFFNEYWKEQIILIDYFLIDYTINIAYNNISTIKKEFDNVSYNNEKIHELQKKLNNKFDKKEFIKLTSKNIVNKLSYKEQINIEDTDNFYNYIINQ